MASRTTRRPRPGDGEGKTYDYITREAFEDSLRAGELLESAKVHGELYGTPKHEVERLLADGKDVLLEIDVQGARQVKESVSDAVTIFVEPPSWKELVERLQRRGTEDEAGLRLRLDTARRELVEAGSFDHRVVNDDLDEAVEAVNRILGPEVITG